MQLDSQVQEPSCVECGYRAQLAAIMECAFDGMYITDGNGVFLEVNQSIERVTGLKREELIGTRAPDLVTRGLLDKSVTATVLRTKMRTTILQTIKGPIPKECMVTSSPVLDSQGTIRYIVANLRDMTELVKLRDECARSRELVREYGKQIAKLSETWGGVLSHSPNMERLMDEATQVARTAATVLLEGESGTGKELLARFIHFASLRAESPFVAINCGAVPENLMEAELFGYEKGAFTGASPEGKIGLLHAGSGGTVFLDEVESCPLSLQGKLLRALEDAEAIPVGGVKPKPFNCRFIASSNRDLAEMCRKGEFRYDLYYRLKVVHFRLPPLRERIGDVELLSKHFLDSFNKQYSTAKQVSPEALSVLCKYSWPGNIRELKNLVERLVITTRGDVILPQDLPPEIRAVEPTGSTGYSFAFEEIPPLSKVIQEVEEALLRKAIAELGSTRAAARALGISQPSVVRRLKKIRDKQLNR